MTLADRPRTVMITGAGGVIGTALVRAFAAPGTTLALLGRDPVRLGRAAHEAEARGARALTWSMDLTDRPRAVEAMLRIDDEHPLDLLIANAGLMLPPAGAVERWQDLDSMLETNASACLVTATALAGRMVARGRGQIALMGSLAGLRGLALTPGYSASKAAVRAYGEALRGRLAGTGVRLTVVHPGVVASPMGDSFPGRKLLVSTPDEVARRVRSGLERDRARVAFPLPMALGLDFLAILPVGLGNALLDLTLGRR